MPSSISNSDVLHRTPSGPWGRTWLLAVGLACVTLVGVEQFWRSRGHQPGVPDDERLWAYHRGRVYGDADQTLVFVGRSRIVTGLQLDLLKTLCPDANIVQLAVIGQPQVSVFEDLAEDEAFRGTVVCDVVPPDLWQAGRAKPIPFLEYYRAHAHQLTERIDLGASLLFRQSCVALSPHVSLRSVWREWRKSGQLVSPPRYLTAFDRSKGYDFDNMDVTSMQESVLKRFSGKPMSADRWLKQAAEIEPYVARIQARGGRVVFLHCPVSGALRERLDASYPREKFWDAFAANTQAQTIHFADVPGMASLECPDYSHLDTRDRPQFTQALARQLAALGLVRLNEPGPLEDSSASVQVLASKPQRRSDNLPKSRKDTLAWVLKVGGRIKARDENDDTWDVASPADLDRARHIESIDLQGCKVNDRMVAALSSIAELKELDLSRTAITDVGLSQLSGFAKLRKLSLRGVKLQGKGLERLQTMPKLQSLTLSGCSRLQSDQLAHLTGCDQLRWLTLSGSSVDERCLKHLAEVPTLKRVLLADTKLTLSDVDRIRPQLPQCEFVLK